MKGWEKVDEGVWRWEKTPKNGFVLNTLAVELGGGELGIVSPSRRLGDEAHEALREIGRPTLLIAPNHFHWLGLAEWHERYSGIRIVASHAAKPRVEDKTKLKIDIAEGTIGDGVQTVVPPGTKNGELWVRRGDALIVGDAWFNAPTPEGTFGFVFRALRVTPGLQVSRTWTTLGLSNKRAYRDFVVQSIGDSRPDMIVPCHGEPLTGAAVEEAIEMVKERV